MKTVLTKKNNVELIIITTAILIVVFTSSSLQSKPYTILDGESPYSLPSLSLETRLLLGYETGHIPDAFIRPWVDLGILSWLTLGGGIYYTWFPDRHESRLTEWEVRGKLRFLDIPPRNKELLGFIKTGGTQMFGYVKYRRSENSIIEGLNRIHGNIAVVSPRADGGWDATGGVSIRTEFSMFRQNFGLFATADYAWTGGRNYYPNELKYQNRLTANIMPVYYINSIPQRFVEKDSLFVGVQNRFTYWFKRGNMYNVMPQATWEFRKNMSLSAGVSIPATSHNDFRFLVEFSALFETSTISASIDVDPDDDFTPDGNGVNDILYLKPSIRSKETVRDWTITIKDGKRTIKTFHGTGQPQDKIAWNGKSDSNYLIESLKKYSVVIRAVDSKGNGDKDDTTFTSGLILETIPNGYKIVISNIEFATGKDTIRKQAFPVLNKIADYLDRHYPDYTVKVQGHTDNVGGTSYNEKLSSRRAKSVMNYLIKEGIDRGRLTSNGFGESMPIDNNNTEEGRARNRRVEFILQKKDK
jgi:outer membrane protein OmpA-like peptidoglycan-associated protein